MIERVAIIVAGGVGSRMNSDLPKQFLILKSKPILMYSLERFQQSNPDTFMILVLAEGMISYWQLLCEEYHFDVPHSIVKGGKSRFQSVKNGLIHLKSLQKMTESTLIAVHDGARPLISTILINNLYQSAVVYEAVIPGVQSSNSVRIGNLDRSQSIDRNQVWLIQTPQIFQQKILFKAYEQEENSFFTDDASVVEALGKPIRIEEGEYTNLKITYPEDIAIAEMYLQ